MPHIKWSVTGVVVIAAIVSSFAFAGVGFHWGTDLSLTMDDTEGLGERITLEDVTLDLSPLANGAELKIDGVNSPVFVSRTDWQRKMFNIGGKAYIDFIPVIDGVELSCNFGLWEYKGVLSYPTGLNPNKTIDEIRTNPTAPDNYTFGEKPLTLEEFGMDYWGLKNTPYAKFHIDATVRKYVLKIPPVINIVKIYTGAGLSTHFATPMLDNEFVAKVLKTELGVNFDPQSLAGEELGRAILDELIAGLSEPTIGAHVAAGAAVSIPILPVGIYADAKYMLPFTEMGSSLTGMGLLVNVGISVGF